MTIKDIDEIIEQGNSLKQIAQAYAEIANLKIKRIRSEVERNRIFFKEIADVYSLVKKMALKKKIIIPKLKKRVSIIITSNYRFYGNINSALIDFFITNTEKLETDRVIIGNAALDYFKNSGSVGDYMEVLLKKDQPDPEELKSLTNKIEDYNQVLVFYSRLESLMVQLPTVLDITASASAQTFDIVPSEDKKVRFIFEPELAKTLAFFDSQILTLLLEQTFLESEVARTASRFISMDKAETEANKFIKEYIKLKSLTQLSIDSNKLLEAIAASKKGMNNYV